MQALMLQTRPSFSMLTAPVFFHLNTQQLNAISVQLTSQKEPVFFNNYNFPFHYLEKNQPYIQTTTDI